MHGTRCFGLACLVAASGLLVGCGGGAGSTPQSAAETQKAGQVGGSGMDMMQQQAEMMKNAPSAPNMPADMKQKMQGLPTAGPDGAPVGGPPGSAPVGAPGGAPPGK